MANSNLLTLLPRHFVSVTGIADQLVLRPLPLDLAPVHLDAVWHSRVELQSAHLWLQNTIKKVAKSVFSPIDTIEKSY